MRYVRIAEHYKVEAAVKLEQYRGIQEAVVKMQQEAESWDDAVGSPEFPP
jgi:hypothetical protein